MFWSVKCTGGGLSAWLVVARAAEVKDKEYRSNTGSEGGD